VEFNVNSKAEFDHQPN